MAQRARRGQKGRVVVKSLTYGALEALEAQMEATVGIAKAIIVGFTGTSKRPLTPRQLKALRRLLWNVDELHLGDCINADAEAHAEAILLGVKTVGHPPIDGRRRAYCTYDEEREPKPFLERNRDIVRDGVDGLIACPGGFVEEWRSGTWATVRCARKLGRRIWIVRPDGRVIEEP